MRIASRFALVLAAAAIGVGAVTAGAVAKPPRAAHARLIQASATYLELSVQQLREQLRAGKSLAEVADAQGKSVDGLEAAIVADAKARLDRAVADGKITADRAARILTRLQANVERIVQRTGPPPRGKARPGRGVRAAVRGAIRASAAYLGLSVQQVRTQLADGKSLAQIAEANGKPVEGLKDAILADAKAAIDKLVSSGRLRAERGQRYLKQIQAHLDDLVNRTRPPR